MSHPVGEIHDLSSMILKVLLLNPLVLVKLQNHLLIFFKVTRLFSKIL